MIQRISGYSKFEEMAAYSRAVVVDNRIEISGTTSSDGINTKYPDDIYSQTKMIFGKFEEILRKLDSSMDNIIRIRYYVTDITQWREVAKVANEYLSDAKPAATMIEVSNLIDPDMLIEIELTAIKSN